MSFNNAPAAKAGDNGVAIVGNNNTVISLDKNSPQIIPRSYIADICKSIADMNIEFDDDYSIQQNSDWMDKFNYNLVHTYVDIFDNYSDGYDDLIDILRGNKRRSVMVMKIRTVYLKIDGSRPKNTDGDYIIEQVFKTLKDEICNQNLIAPINLADEEIDSAIYLIMFYAFTKCKLLKPVPKEEKKYDY